MSFFFFFLTGICINIVFDISRFCSLVIKSSIFQVIFNIRERHTERNICKVARKLCSYKPYIRAPTQHRIISGDLKLVWRKLCSGFPWLSRRLLAIVPILNLTESILLIHNGSLRPVIRNSFNRINSVDNTFFSPLLFSFLLN